MWMVASLSFKTIYRLNKRQNRYQENLFLLKKEQSDDEDAFGFGKTEYKIVQEIHGIIQRPQEQEIDFKGEESNPDYVGYFLPEFLLETKDIADYRIKYVRPHETLCMKITDYNPNLFLRGKRDHIQLGLIIEKKNE